MFHSVDFNPTGPDTLPPGGFAHRLFKMSFAKNLKTSRMKRIGGIQIFATRCRRTRQTHHLLMTDVLLHSSGVHRVGHTAMMFLNKLKKKKEERNTIIRMNQEMNLYLEILHGGAPQPDSSRRMTLGLQVPGRQALFWLFYFPLCPPLSILPRPNLLLNQTNKLQHTVLHLTCRCCHSSANLATPPSQQPPTDE